MAELRLDETSTWPDSEEKWVFFKVQWKFDLVNHKIVNFHGYQFTKLPNKALEIVIFCNLVNL